MVISLCEHVRIYKQKEDFIPTYELLVAAYVSCILEKSLKKKARDCVCMKKSCKESHHRIHACLSCPFFGCFNKAHIHEHAEENTHPLAMDTNYGFIYCFECQDYQYDTDCEKILHNFNSIAAHKRGTLLNFRSKRNSCNVDHLSNCEIDTTNLGLKGIVNMGATCYLSVIIQSLVHAPAFRNYFLSLNHRFPFSNTWNVVDQKAKVAFNCVTCEMADIVQEIFFSVKEEILAPHLLLYFVWKNDALLRDEFQDAHHCYLTLLSLLHPNCSESSDMSCKCFIGKLFTGDMQLKYICNNCRAVFCKNSSFKHLPLVCCPEASSEDNGSPIIQSFDECIKRSMQSEIGDYQCSQCNKKGVKELMILMKLPVIINFLMKDGSDGSGSKDDGISKVYIPESLDMSPHIRHNKRANGLSKNPDYQYYLFAAVEYRSNTRQKKKSSKKEDLRKKDSKEKDSNKEDSRKKNSKEKDSKKKKNKEQASTLGHYVCYVKQYKGKLSKCDDGTWFECNDESIKRLETKDFLQKKMYMLFYHKKFFAHDLLSMQEESFS